MGNYREQYEKYYGNIKANSGAASYKRASAYQGNNLKKENNENKNFLESLIKKFIWQLSISFILLVVVFAVKYIPIEGAEGEEFYKTSKDIISEDLNVSSVINDLDVPEAEVYKEKFLDYIDEVKASVAGEGTLKEVIKEDYIKPVNGKIKYINGQSKGIAISAEESDEVLSVYGGTVEQVKDDDEKFVIINHGNGTVTCYESLSEVSVEAGDAIDKGEAIGKCGNIDTTEKKGVIFKFIYLGNEKNPSDVMDLSSLEEV